LATPAPPAGVETLEPPVADDTSDRIADLLHSVRRGDREGLDALVPLVYDELRRLARGYVGRERPGATLQATALVHEAWTRLAGAARLEPQNRAHFMAIAANLMRQILVERARARRAAKRGGDPERVTLHDERLPAAAAPGLDVEALDEALARLAREHPDQARLVELRFFGGLSIEETAEAMRLSPATVKRRWTLAKAWLLRELGA
jgi:RNA polymerase sigma-70 factor, ECF subfamily